MDLLACVASARTPQLLGELAAATGLNRSTAWRLLMTLEYHGLVERDPRTQAYVAGYELLHLAGANPRHQLVRAGARGPIDRLARETGETVSLLVPTASGIVAIDQRDENPRLASVSIVGVQLPLHAAASGKLRLAYATPEELPMLLGAAPKRFTSRTITEPGDIKAELEAVRRRGYAVEREEFEPGVSGLSAPVFDSNGHALAFVSIWGLTAHLPNRRLKELALTVRSAADEITTILAAEADEPATRL
jgi:IclR family acetate operon transcriptional repressor